MLSLLELADIPDELLVLLGVFLHRAVQVAEEAAPTARNWRVKLVLCILFSEAIKFHAIVLILFLVFVPLLADVSEHFVLVFDIDDLVAQIVKNFAIFIDQLLVGDHVVADAAHQGRVVSSVVVEGEKGTSELC